MKIAGRKSYLLNLESVAMTDIILNMFIFFFISFSLLYTFNTDRLKKLGIKLPKTQSPHPITDSVKTDILVTAEGIIYLDQKPITRNELEAILAPRLKENSAAPIILKADRSVEFDEVFNVIDSLKKLGAENVSIAAISEQLP
ncbi:MAG: biopolymer transporter ExbD [Candidatus Omnitrophica bacterium]|nr:biopolymer transporter ExbD [Candidatus Omnitrophota bacterium]